MTTINALCLVLPAHMVAMAVPTAAKLNGAVAIAVTKHLVNLNAVGVQEMNAKTVLLMTKTQMVATQTIFKRLACSWCSIVDQL